MKKRFYIQPDTEIIGVLPFRLMDESRGWAKDANPPTTVEQEAAVKESDRQPSSLWDGQGYGGFLDLD